MTCRSRGSESESLDRNALREVLYAALDELGARKKVLAIPPDFTRFHSRAGVLTELVWQRYRERLADVLPALGTHVPMNAAEIGRMFGATPKSLFRVHDWKGGIETLGMVPASFVRRASEGRLDWDWPAQVNRMLPRGGHDLILSIGQIVPHEVSGMANYNKNIFVGTGGADGINKSHFLGAVYGLERIMGRMDNPVRQVLNYASEHFARDLPIVYVLTVVGRDPSGGLRVRGLYVGDGIECFERAAELSLKVNFEIVQQPLRTVVVYLDPEEYRSTWLGNKSIYRTRMAIADGGQLIVLAPGVREFGEDKDIDRLIRKYGYAGTPRILEAVDRNRDLQDSLAAAAHLIHGSSEGRFNITYCPGHLTQREIEGVGFGYADLAAMQKKYDPAMLRDGINSVDGREVFYISNPALGLWTSRERFVA